MTAGSPRAMAWASRGGERKRRRSSRTTSGHTTSLRRSRVGSVLDASEYRPLEGLPLPVVVLRAERVVYANPALTALFGASTEELSHLSMAQLLERFLPQERTWVEPMYEAHVRGERPPDSELWLRLRDAEGR